MIIPTAEPFFFPGGSVGILLVHGFTGAPREMRWMGEYLAKQGYSVLGVRLAGHATCPDDMLRVAWQDWLNSVADGYHILKGISDQIVVAGLSMGGILTLLFAARYQVNGLVAMSTPYAMPPDPRLRYLHLLWRFKPKISKGPPDWGDPSLADDHVDYPYYPTKAIIEVNSLVSEMQAALPSVNVPVLLIHAKKDNSISYGDMQNIFNHLGSQDKSMFTIENSGHVITRDLDKELVFDQVNQFVQRICHESP